MKLNTCNLIPEILMLHGNIIDMVAVDLTEVRIILSMMRNAAGSVLARKNPPDIICAHGHAGNRDISTRWRRFSGHAISGGARRRWVRILSVAPWKFA